MKENLIKLKERVNTKEKNFSEVIYKRVGEVKKPTKTFHQNLSYDFLQYIRIIFKWACSNYEITRPHLELLLAIYPIGIFNKKEFILFSRTVDINPLRLFNKFVEDGWIKEWRPQKSKQAALYCLTSRGKIMCGKIHKICVGESKIPEYKYGNSLATSDKAIDKYYIDIIKKMNSRKLEDAKDVIEDDI